MSDAPDPTYFSSLTSDLARRAARGAVSVLAPISDPLRHHLVDRLERPAGTPGSFIADPVFEATFGWEEGPKPMQDLAGTLLHRRVVEAMDAPPKAFSEQRFGRDRHPYEHQVKAWKHLRKEPPRSIVVTSGTGSGKTECFLVPILDDLARQAESAGRLSGVRALFLYPLNALINSQRDRLRAWLDGFGGDVRFCLYNGETPQSVPAAQQREHVAEVLSRTELRRDPAPILVTNSTMLEYMLVRQDDAPILRLSSGCLRWVVLDEAHTYLGSRAAEIALLLRRVLHAFAVDTDAVRFVATSATIADAGDKNGVADLQRFLADVAGVELDRVAVVEGRQRIPQLPTPRSSGARSSQSLPSVTSLSPAERFDLVSARDDARTLRDLLTARPHRLSELAGRLCRKDQAEVAEDDRLRTLELLDACASAQRDGSSFLPLRGHFFHRTQRGVWVCANSGCNGREGHLDSPVWGFGRVFLERRARCESCDAPVFELLLCSECGAEYLCAEEQLQAGGRSVIIARQLQQEEDEFDLEQDVQEDDEAAVEPPPEGRLPRLLCGAPAPNAIEVRIDPATGALVSDGSLVVFQVLPDPTAHGFRCLRCTKLETREGELFRPARVGAPFFLGGAIPALLEHVDPKTREHGVAPFGGRRLITFSDSRQATARFAVQAQIDAERNFVRSFVYHQVAATRPQTDAAGSEQIRDQLDLIRQLPEKPSLTRLIQDLTAQLARAGGGQPGRLPWAEARDALDKTGEVSRWMPRHWYHLAQADAVKGREAQFCLLREFMRRPKRQNSLETLGLVSLRYPRLAHVAEATMPTAWRRANLPIEEWRDFLKLALDYVVRGASAVDVPGGLLRWMGVPMRSRFIVAPDGDRGPLRVLWPRVRAGQVRARLPLLLFRGLDLDPDDPSARADVNEILDAAWPEVRRLLSQFADGYQLRLEAEAELVELREAWLCPVTRRVLDTTFRGLSPYLNPDARREQVTCQRIQLPELPYAYWVEEGGRPLSNEDRVRWLETDSKIAAARRLGFWTGYSDRIALLSEYFRVGEHSAQQQGKRLQQLEEEFKAGTLNVLSCSTTMEMGVDIGGLTGIAMNNAPPGPANFRQRAGRAGRRGEATAFSFTLCKSDPHGEAVFANPLWAFTERTHVPRVSLQSDRIVQRHLNALALTRFLAAAQSGLPQLTAGWFFDRADGALAPSDRFESWLLDGTAAQDDWLAAGIRQVAKRTLFDGVDAAKLLAGSALHLRGICERWREEVESLTADLATFAAGGSANPSPAELALRRQLERIRQEYLLRDLTMRGFLPGHGFPTDVVAFVPTTLEELKRAARGRARDGGLPAEPLREREDNFGRRAGYPSRDLPLAIRDYAPGSDVVIDGQVFRSGGVTLNWHIPPGDHEVREIQSFRFAWRCRRCGASETRTNMIAECPACGADGDRLRQHQYLEPAGFAVDIRYQPTNDLTQRQYVPVEQPWISAGIERWLPLPRLELGRYRYSAEGNIFHYSKGHTGEGFAICLRCGRAASEHAGGALPDELTEHSRLRGGKEADGNSRCAGNDEPWAIKRHEWLGATFHTDVFELQLRDPATGLLVRARPAAYSIAVAMRQALAEVLGVNQREIGCAAIPSRDESGMRGCSVALFDTAAGGAGFVRTAQVELGRLLRRARDILHCRRDCDAACHACLLAYDTQHQLADLDRHAALTVLSTELVEGLELPAELRVFGPDSRLEFERLPLALSRELQRKGTAEVRVHLGGRPEDWDPFEWPLRQALSQFRSEGGNVRLLTPRKAIDGLPLEVANALASVVEAGGFELRATEAARTASGTPLLIAESSGPDGVTRWASSTPEALAPGRLWGLGETDDRIVRVVRDGGLEDCPGSVVRPASLRRVPDNVVRELTIAGQLDGPIAGFSARWWQTIAAAAPELSARLQNGPSLAQVLFRDRYLRSPLTMRLLREVIRGLDGTAGGLGAETSVRIETAELGNDQSYRSPDRFADNWQHEANRREVFLRTVAPGRPAQFETARLRQAPHQRELLLRWPDGTWLLRLDQGLGFLAARRPLRFPFDAGAEEQARALVGADFEVANHNDHPSILYLGALKPA